MRYASAVALKSPREATFPPRIIDTSRIPAAIHAPAELPTPKLHRKLYNAIPEGGFRYSRRKRIRKQKSTYTIAKANATQKVATNNRTGKKQQGGEKNIEEKAIGKSLSPTECATGRELTLLRLFKNAPQRRDNAQLRNQNIE